MRVPGLIRCCFAALTCASFLGAQVSPSVNHHGSMDRYPHQRDMVLISSGDFEMGATVPKDVTPSIEDALRDAEPVHKVHVSSFWMDRTLVTNAEFAEFVKTTGYVTVAERKPNPRDYPDADPKDLVPGGVVFTPPAHAVPLDDPYQWWKYVAGANWRHPLGPKSNLNGHWQDPVVQVTFEDAAAYAKWIGGRLPTEAEWEFAARGGLKGKIFAWGDTMSPHDMPMANTYQGHFPYQNSKQDKYAGVSPVGSYPANGYGLFDMTGNVWEWVGDWYRPDYYAELASKGVAVNPRGPATSFDPAEPGQKKRVQRGGSFLCSPEYCSRYMVGARGKGDIDIPTNHVGFRCVKDVAQTTEGTVPRAKASLN